MLSGEGKSQGVPIIRPNGNRHSGWGLTVSMGNPPRRKLGCGSDCGSERPLVSRDPRCTLKETAAQKCKQRKPICELGPHGLP